MRPIKLRMKAFISYKDEQIIDFSKFTDGLFLIEGDIGAGKTTIFDAISFASSPNAILLKVDNTE